ncbi:uncharacterized BrkB/YihY/UPF0761 family membrane protein [Neomicrococcus aestuarii]|uniref:Uncharacterized BrkB/YihY/UPF0761 family membrane protein n=1 Tax=Neomicrococcus aestuarii TaxID=556325 RepID=A0A7W8X1J3_9MICC|nr:hypothetical protein [Neomicrococcus aestuarii]MBB5512854.1 uncharacterized BrkB/YihY/UPF0761 family membrane protein [Neomicrococcus aestuarii]
MSEMMKQGHFSYVRGAVFSFVRALGITVLATLSSLLNQNSGSLARSVSTVAVFYAVPIIIGALLATVVSMGLFALGNRGEHPRRGVLLSVVGVILLGFAFALGTGQIPTYDITALLIIGCCAGALTGPVSALVVSRR